MTTFLITGNLGYIGPVLQHNIKKYFPKSNIIGIDTGFFRDSVISIDAPFGNPNIDTQYYADLRNEETIENVFKSNSVDYVIHLSSISNDSMGSEFESVTHDINHDCSISLAKLAVKYNIKSFVFASSCSVYGKGFDSPRTETDTVNPLTAYAKSKISTEADLLALISNEQSTMKTTCLRFSTACGFSPRLRLDLVLNDFVATALSTGEINILSDGTPWRPLIDVEDMSKLMIWSCLRNQGDVFEIYNAGAEFCNYQVIDLARKVDKILLGKISIKVNSDAASDDRSYKVDFSKLLSVVDEEFKPSVSLTTSIENLLAGMSGHSLYISPSNRDHLIRLKVLRSHKQSMRLDGDLFWNNNNFL